MHRAQEAQIPENTKFTNSYVIVGQKMMVFDQTAAMMGRIALRLQLCPGDELLRC
jgi:hypothetical protein